MEWRRSPYGAGPPLLATCQAHPTCQAYLTSAKRAHGEERKTSVGDRHGERGVRLEQWLLQQLLLRRLLLWGLLLWQLPLQQLLLWQLLLSRLLLGLPLLRWLLLRRLLLRRLLLQRLLLWRLRLQWLLLPLMLPLAPAMAKLQLLPTVYHLANLRQSGPSRTGRSPYPHQSRSVGKN